MLPQVLQLLLQLLPLLLTTTRRGTSCSQPASSAYRHPMAAVRVIDDLLATTLLLLLLLCSLWRRSTKSNTTTATTTWMRASRAPNERFARGKVATKMWCVLEHSKQLNADPLEPASRPRSTFQLTFACPTPAYQTPPEREQKQNKKLQTRSD